MKILIAHDGSSYGGKALDYVLSHPAQFGECLLRIGNLAEDGHEERPVEAAVGERQPRGVGGEHAHAPRCSIVQPPPQLLDHAGLQVNADNLPAVAYGARRLRREVARSGADLEHALTGIDPERGDCLLGWLDQPPRRVQQRGRLARREHGAGATFAQPQRYGERSERGSDDEGEPE